MPGPSLPSLGSPARLEEAPLEIAPDGSRFRRLIAGTRAQLGHCELAAGQITTAVEHRSVEEFWYVLAGTGRLWRRAGDREAIIDLEPGMALALSPGVRFQVRAAPSHPLRLLIATAPPWPGDHEARPVAGPW